MSYKLVRPEMSAEEVKEMKNKGAVVRLVSTEKDGSIWEIDGYRVLVRRR